MLTPSTTMSRTLYWPSLFLMRQAERYGGHFEVVLRDLHESDDLRVLDFNGERAFRLFRLAELGSPIIYEEE